MLSHVRAVVVSFCLLTVLTGVIYPALITALAQGLFSRQANGSIVERNGTPIGSELIGQQFDDPRYFWGRPSATSPTPYNGASSTGSNLGPSNPAFLDAVAARVAAIRQAHPDRTGPVPADLVTASASGLDPHISRAAAEYQIARVAKARNFEESKVRALVASAAEGRALSVLGEPRVNVLRLNLELDEMTE